MEKRKIYVIFNPEQFTKDEIVLDLQEEGYVHEFYIDDGILNTDAINNIKTADEVWLFGKCLDQNAYKLAEANGADFWIMG